MDTYEILSAIRSFCELPNEDDIGTIQLLTIVNISQMLVAQEIMILFHEFMVESYEYSSQTGSTVAIPENMTQIVSLERKDSDGDFQPASRVGVSNKPLIDRDLNFQSYEKHPLYVHEGKNLYIYPTLSSTDVRLRYRRRVEDLFWGSITRQSDTTATIPAMAEPVDDIYNDYRIGVYSLASGVFTFEGLGLITDYVGSTKVATVSGVTISAGTTYWAGLVSLIPNEFHNIILESGIINTKRINRFKDRFPKFDFQKEKRDLSNNIKNLVQTYLTI